jgi:hypothetical protein
MMGKNEILWCAEGDQSPVIWLFRADVKLTKFSGLLLSVFSTLRARYRPLQSATDYSNKFTTIKKKSSTAGSTSPAWSVI